MFSWCLIGLFNSLVGLLLYSFFFEICYEYYVVYRNKYLTITMILMALTI